MIRRGLIIGIFWSIIFRFYGQFQPLLFDWEGNYLSEKTSAFLFPGENFQMALPATGNFDLAFRHSGFTAYDLFNTAQTDFNEKWQKALSNLKPGNGMFFYFRNQWLGFGWKNFDIHYRVSVSTESKLWFFHPVSLYRNVLFGLNENSPEIDLKQINFNGELLTRYTFGFTKIRDQFFQYGFNFHMYNVGMAVSSSGNKGKIYTRHNGNIYTTRLENIKLNLRSAGIRSFYEKDRIGSPEVNTESAAARFKRRLFLGGNFGLGMDYGFRKILLNDWALTFHVSDLGVIFYTTDLYSYKVRGSYTYSGVQAEFPDTPKDYWAEVKEIFKGKIQEKSHHKPFLKLTAFRTYFSIKKYWGVPKEKTGKRLPCYNPSNDYSVKSKLPYVGLMGFYQNLQGRPYLGAAVYGQWYPTSWLDVRLSYGFDTFVPNNLGLAVQFRIWKWHWMISADNLLSLKDISKSNGFALTFGSYFSF